MSRIVLNESRMLWIRLYNKLKPSTIYKGHQIRLELMHLQSLYIEIPYEWRPERKNEWRYFTLSEQNS